MAKKSSKSKAAKAPVAKAAPKPPAAAKTLYRLCEAAEGRQFIGECNSAAAATKMAAEYQLKNAVNVEVARGKLVGGKFAAEFSEVIPLRDLAGTAIDQPPPIAAAEATAIVEAAGDATPAPAAKSPAKAKRAAKEPKAKTPKAKSRPARAAKKMSALDAAAKVLDEKGEAMNCQDLIEAMAKKGYWTSPNGATPHATLYAAILREINHKGKEARFQKTDRGHFAIAR